MRDVPTLALVLTFYVASYFLALVEVLSNRIYPRTKLSFSAFANKMLLFYLIMFPLLLPTMLVSPSPGVTVIGWRDAAFFGAVLLGGSGITIVAFRTEMLMHGLGFGRTLLVQLPKLPVGLIVEAGILLLMLGTELAWDRLPPTLREFVRSQAAPAWKIVSEL